MPEINIQDLFEIQQDEDRPSSMIRTTTQKINSHQVFLDSDIGDPAKYRELINLLYMCAPDDEVNMFINSCGGNLNSCMSIIEGIRASEASIRAILTGDCMSAASIIALNCHEIFVTDSALMMIHTAQFSTGGSTHAIQKHADFSSKYINGILDRTYTGFLTPDEMTQVRMGVELWFDASEIRQRLENRVKYLEGVKKKTLSKTTKK